MPTRLFVAMVLSFAQFAAGGETLKPRQLGQFFVPPADKATLAWDVEAAGPDATDSLDFVIRDYSGKTIAAGQAGVAPQRTVEVRQTFAQGFYDVEFPKTGQRFGVVATPAWQGPRDAFFAIDGALSWLVRDDDVRRALLAIARRSGIGMVRERLSWGGVEPQSGRWEWEDGRRYETVRRMAAEQKIAVLEMAHDAPGWMGRVAKYPADLAAGDQAWRAIARRWRPTWGAVEIWNEPDIHFGGNLPADQYAAVAKTLAYSLSAGAEAGDRVPVVGGVMANFTEPFLAAAGDNGLLEAIDAFSFHTYEHAGDMERLVGRYRGWLAAHGAEAMPLWLTECGRPWRRGPARPPRAEDAASGLDIAMKGVEARACGVARYFPFVYPYYEENANNFGMMGREATPLGSMAAYVQLVRAMAGLEYLGDLKTADKSLRRARVFGDPQRTVAVLYTGRVEPAAKVRVGLPVTRLEGIDGRELQADADGGLPIPDGLVYAWIARRRLGDRLDAAVPAMKLWNASRRQPPRRGPPSPIVMRLTLDEAAYRASAHGYRVPKSVARLPLVVRVFNLAAEARPLTLSLAIGSRAPVPPKAGKGPVTVPPGGWVDAAWDADVAGAIDAGGRLSVRVAAKDAQDKEVSRLVLHFITW